MTMSLTQPAALIATLVVLGSQHRVLADDTGPAGPPPASVNSITGVTLKQDAATNWLLEFDYTYTGKPAGAGFQVGLPLRVVTMGGAVLPPERVFSLLPGSEHVSMRIVQPKEGTTQVTVSLRAPGPDGAVLATQTVEQVIKLPNPDDVDFDNAFALIENGHREALRDARMTIERLIAKNPSFDAGYVELARIAMKTNWGPEGLHQAETLLDSALGIRPDSVNAKILLGYVYAHQQRFAEAEKLFADVEPLHPANYWLWTNWGESLELQGRLDQAIAKYRTALAQPAGSFKYDSARRSAYAHLLALLEPRKDFDAMEALYKQRIVEFGPGSCYSADYARFKLNLRGDAQGAIDLARGALNLDCEDAPSRQILGLASYAKWAENDGPASVQALNEARIFLPTGPTALYLLANSDRTLPAVKKLIAAGEPIDQKDNEQMTALAHALQAGALPAIERLLSLGARADTPVGPEAVPVALLPLLTGDVNAILVLQAAGVDYAKLAYRGINALDLAKQLGGEAVLKALHTKSKDRTL